jgi:16S rRNA (guanine527-N7)-methyltransferase
VSDVSRETPAVPVEARRVFAVGRLPLAERYAELLATEGVVRGLIGPREAPRLWERHLLNCAVLAELVPESASVADVGSGAGLPGVVLAIAPAGPAGDVGRAVAAPHPLPRRGGGGARAPGAGRGGPRAREELAGTRTFDVVTARAVAPLERLARWCLPLVDPAGSSWRMKGPRRGPRSRRRDRP